MPENPAFEDMVARKMFSQDSERTFIDKVLSRKDVDEIRNIIKKERLSRTDLIELLYLVGGVESKLVNLGLQERYIILKFYVWIREFVMVAEMIYDYEAEVKKKRLALGMTEDNLDEVTKRTDKLFDTCKLHIEHSIKFLCDLYLNILRTSLSIGATGFMNILTNKFELDYRAPNPVNTQTNMQEKKGWFGLSK